MARQVRGASHRRRQDGCVRVFVCACVFPRHAAVAGIVMAGSLPEAPVVTPVLQFSAGPACVHASEAGRQAGAGTRSSTAPAQHAHLAGGAQHACVLACTKPGRWLPGSSRATAHPAPYPAEQAGPARACVRVRARCRVVSTPPRWHSVHALLAHRGILGFCAGQCWSRVLIGRQDPSPPRQ
jgi:hypothetical protein